MVVVSWVYEPRRLRACWYRGGEDLGYDCTEVCRQRKRDRANREHDTDLKLKS
jgi:hypothetical protein